MSGISLEPIIVIVGFWLLAINALGAMGYIDYVIEHEYKWRNIALLLCAFFFPLNWTYIFFFLFVETKTRRNEKIIRKEKKIKAIEKCKEIFQKQPEKIREVLQVKGLLNELLCDIGNFDFTFRGIERCLNGYERKLLVYIIKNNIDVDCDEVLNFTSECYRILKKYV